MSSDSSNTSSSTSASASRTQAGDSASDRLGPFVLPQDDSPPRGQPDHVYSKDEVSAPGAPLAHELNSPPLIGSFHKDYSILIGANPTRPASLQSSFKAVNETSDSETTPSTLFVLSVRNAYNLRPPHYIPSFVHGRDATPAHVDARVATRTLRQISGGFWIVGGRVSLQSGQLQGIPSGAGGFLASGTTAPLHTAAFLDDATHDDKAVAHERRLALALDIDQASRILTNTTIHQDVGNPGSVRSPFAWRNGAWAREIGRLSSPKNSELLESEKAVPTVPFRVLDAPNLKDDYYCSILAYSYTCHTLAVALGQKVYLWTEQYGVRYPPLPPARATNFVTSLAFSSEAGGRAILAVARNSGNVTIWSLLEPKPRFDAPHPSAASCVAFKPVVTRRPDVTGTGMTSCEDLLVGDDLGKIYYYSVEWPELGAGSMTLLAKIDAHSQNICGLSWSSEGHHFVSGGNDNRALLFNPDVFLYTQYERSFSQDAVQLAAATAAAQHAAGMLVTPPVSPKRQGAIPQEETVDSGTVGAVQNVDILSPPPTPLRRGREQTRTNPRRNRRTFEDQNIPPRQQSMLRNALANPSIPGQANVHMYSFYHSAAVKAIAFAPWQPNLLATGGGSNDRQIHFFHTGSGATLALIDVFSQVTSLVWSITRRELVATFGYSQPEHEIRIAVFSWPSCECVVSIPWERKQNGEIGRALWAIPYPGGPNDAVPTRRQSESNEGFAAWEVVRRREAERRRGTAAVAPGVRRQRSPAPSPDRAVITITPTSASRSGSWSRPRDSQPRRQLRGEGEPWASRTNQEGSLIIACCDQTVKFFEIWAGKSKGKKNRGLGNRPGVLGGSRVLEGWCDYIDVDEIGFGEDVIR